MLSSVLDSFGAFVRPLAIALLILIGLGYISNPSDSGGPGLSCRPLTDNVSLNRALCRMNPTRLWNTPVADLIPGLRTSTAGLTTEGSAPALR